MTKATVSLGQSRYLLPVNTFIFRIFISSVFEIDPQYADEILLLYYLNAAEILLHCKLNIFC